MKWLNGDELIYVLGHEVARIKSQNMIYHQMAVVMPTLKHLLSSTTLGLGGLFASGLELALYNWVMMSKFTADRAGLLACQDIDVATTALLKLAGLPQDYLNAAVIEDFLIQAREFSSNNIDNIDQVTKILSYSESGLSWIVMRTGELLKWVDSGEYHNLIQQQDLNTPTETEGWNFLTSW
jgi:Zn-dependent protease with chaperone function